VNYEDGGFNCLFEASLAWLPELFEMLVNAGANVNCFADDEYSSLYSWIIFDQWYEENEGSKGGELIAKVVKIMEQHGAKLTDDCYAEKPEKYISINEHRELGMVSMGGKLAIEKLPNAGKELIDDFNAWLKSSHQEWMKEKIVGTDGEWQWKSPPNYEQLNQHKKDGLELARKIKRLVGSDISVDYYFVEPEPALHSRHIIGYKKIEL
jgi:hypothetical protein